jgi:uncharacterized protein (TIGR03435 family)
MTITLRLSCLAVAAISAAGASVRTARQAASTTSSRFEVVSIRAVGLDDVRPGNTGYRILPGGRFEANAVMLTHLVRFAYDLQPAQKIIGGESLLRRSFTIRAKAADDIAVPPRSTALGSIWEPSTFNDMVRTMLAERFALRTHWRDEEVTTGVLKLVTPGEAGPNLRKRSTPCLDRAALSSGAPPTGDSMRCGVTEINGVVAGAVASLSGLADTMTLWMTVGRNPQPITFVDDTGLAGSFDVATKFNVLTLPGYAGVVNPAPQPYAEYPSMTEALRKDLGLRIESERRTVRMLVIDHIEPPTEN